MTRASVWLAVIVISFLAWVAIIWLGVFALAALFHALGAAA